MSSLFEILSQQLDGPALREIGSRLGADEATTRQAVPAALASLLGGLAANSTRGDGAQALHRALERDHDGTVLDNLPAAIAGSDAGPGAGILRHVFGERRVAVESGLGQQTGLDGAAAGKLLTMLAPLVMGALGRNQRQQRLDPGALAGMLGGERQRLREQAPAGLGPLASLLDADGDGQIGDDVARVGAGLLGGLLGRRK